MFLISSFLEKIAQFSIWQDKIKEKYGISCYPKEPGIVLDPVILRETCQILSEMPLDLVKDCGVSTLYFSSTMGPNRPYYPNHGYYINHSVTFNVNIFYDPDVAEDFFDHHGYFVDRPTQTLFHEFAHGYDVYNHELSLKPEWLKLSDWSPSPKPGLKRLVINTAGLPPVIGEWYFSPNAGFTRFYAKRNPWDDWADSFSFYVARMKSKLPENKIKYFDTLLKKYY